MLGYQFFLGWGPGPSVDHDLLNHIISLRLENVTLKNFVIGCMYVCVYVCSADCWLFIANSLTQARRTSGHAQELADIQISWPSFWETMQHDNCVRLTLVRLKLT
jgi:hypothetical protein